MGDFDRVQESVDTVNKHWANAAEREVSAATGKVLPVWGSRGKPPQMWWRPVLSKDPCRGDGQLFSARWLANVFTEFEGYWTSGNQVGIGLVLERLEQPPAQCAATLGPMENFRSSLAEFVRELPMYEPADGPMLDLFLHMHELCRDTLATIESASRKSARKEWKDWLLFKANRGARRVHTVSKGATPWVPTTTLSLDGVVVADPLSLLQAESKRFSDIWGDAGVSPWFQVGELAPELPEVPVDAIRDFPGGSK